MLLKELADAIPDSRIVRRGKSSMVELGRRLGDDGIGHAIAVYRWHGGPGRIDLFNVNAAGLEHVPPSILLKFVKLRREYSTTGRYVCSCITYGNASAATRRLGHAMSSVLELPEMQSAENTACSLHLRNVNKESAEAVVTSPAGVRDVGPKLVIFDQVW